MNCVLEDELARVFCFQLVNFPALLPLVEQVFDLVPIPGAGDQSED